MTGRVLSLAGIAAALVLPTGASAKSALSLRAPKNPTHVVLTRAADGSLAGTLAVTLHNSGQAGKLTVKYLPAGSGARRATVQVTRPAVPAKRLAAVTLKVRLPADAAPKDLSGLFALQLTKKGKQQGDPLEVGVSGTGDSLTDVTVVPDKVDIQVTDWWPFSDAKRTQARVELRGPGVPALFRPDRRPPTLSMLLRNHDRSILAVLQDLRPTRNPSVATANVRVSGDLAPGRFSGTLPLSDLSTAGPKVSLEVKSRDAFLWAALMVLLGAILGGALYLASNLWRSKELTRAHLKDVLGRYTLKRNELLKGPPARDRLPIWSLEDYLKNEDSWYEVEWTAVPELDGVQGVWSSIYWSRSKDDLDALGPSVTELHGRVVRWLQIAELFKALTEVQALEPGTFPGGNWEGTAASKETKLLLRQLGTIEPADAEAAKDLAGRIRRQARWHAALAHTWNGTAVLNGHMTANPGAYTNSDHQAFQTLKPQDLDAQASPERTRDDEKQIGLEEQLDEFDDTIRRIYKGDPADLDPAGPDRAVKLGALTAVDIRAGADSALLEPEIPVGVRASDDDEESNPLDRAAARVKRAPATIHRVIVSDAIWTVAIAVVTAAAYAPIFYGDSWGAPGDYASAFAAGFLGKAVINWAAFPLFRSLRVTAAGSGDGDVDGAPKAPHAATGADVAAHNGKAVAAGSAAKS